MDAFPLLFFSSKSVRNTFFWLDMVRLGSVAKLLRSKSFCKGLPTSVCLNNCTSAKANEIMRLCGATWRHSLYCIEYATIPPCNTMPYFSTHLPRQFLGVRGLVYKGGAVSRSAACLLGLGADCLCFSSGSSRFSKSLLCGFFRPNYLKRFERSSCGCVSPFGFF